MMKISRKVCAVTCLATVALFGCSSQTSGIDRQRILVGLVCVKPDGNHYGIPDTAKCSAPDKQVGIRPGTGFLGLQARRAINFDTAQEQAHAKTMSELTRRNEAQAKADEIKEKQKAIAEEKRIRPAVDAYMRGRKEGASHEEAVGYAAEVLENQFGGHSYDNWKAAREYIAPQLAKYDSPEWEEKLRKPTRPVDEILDRLTEVRKEATRRIVRDRNLHWDSENDPVRLSVVRELKGVVAQEIRKLEGALSPQDRQYLIDELNKQIESNL
jgi:hypothetical protein